MFTGIIYLLNRIKNYVIIFNANGDVAQPGRAPQWHCGGREFEPLHLHQIQKDCNTQSFLRLKNKLLVFLFEKED